LDKQCEYKDCEEPAVRHFYFHHYCNKHNKILRESVGEDKPESLMQWLCDRSSCMGTH